MPQPESLTSAEVRKGMEEQEARGEFFRQMHLAGEEVNSLREQVKRQITEIEHLKAMNVGLRSERNRSRTECNAALHASKDAIFISSDEDWLFRGDSTLKFGQRSDGSRILVVRVRGKKILRFRGQVTQDSPQTSLMKSALEQARLRETGRNKPRKHTSDETKGRKKRGNVRDKRKNSNEQERSDQKQQEEPEGSS